MSDFQIAAVFSDHMVLQRNKYISVFGYADDKTTVSVSLQNKKGKTLSEETTTSSYGHWEVQLKPQSAQTECKLVITSQTFEPVETQNIKIFEDVAIGEVWIAGGQSNMEFELQNCTEGPEELNQKVTEAIQNVRFYYTNKIAWKDDNFYEAERNTCWQTWNSPLKGSWSAVGYFFAKNLAADLNCTVGIIGCNWGGTSASAWMRKDFLEQDADLNTYLTEYQEALFGKSIEQQIKEFDDYEVENARWQEEYHKLWEKDHNISWESAEKIIGKNPWPGPKSCKNPYRPTGLYDCMLSRIIPFSVKGVLWYQGESDDNKPNLYYKLFSSLIENWRKDFHDNNLPFIFVQLPIHRFEADQDFKHWCLIREAQERVHLNIKNAWMTCALDLGQFNDIHPKAKRSVGERLEKNAMANVYNQYDTQKALSPMFNHFSSTENKFKIYFDNAPDGFEIHEDRITLNHYRDMEKRHGNSISPAFTSFEIAGADKIFYPAAYKFGTDKNELNTITISSPLVKEPVYARYAWYNYGPVTIFGKNGLPLAPFRFSIRQN